MKKSLIKIFIFTILAFVCLEITANAESFFVNENGIDMTKEEYQNLRALGFTDSSISVMSEKNFSENKGIIVSSVVQETRYFEEKIIQTMAPLLTTYSIHSDGLNNEILVTELSKEEYYKRVENLKKEKNKFPRKDNKINLNAINDISVSDSSSSYRTITVSASQPVDSTFIRVQVSYKWDIIPETRDVDILGISILQPFVVNMGSYYGNQTYKLMVSDPYNSTGVYFYSEKGEFNYPSSLGSTYWNHQGDRLTLKMNLKNNEYGTNLIEKKVVELEGWMYGYVSVANVSSLPSHLNFYGIHTHAVKKVGIDNWSVGIDKGGPSLSFTVYSKTDFSEPKHVYISKVFSGWVMMEGNWYYAKEDNTRAVGWLKIGTKYYYFDSDGAMVKGWRKIGATWYYLNPTGGAMVTNWIKLGDYWYYFNASGAMVKGWYKDYNGSWYYLTPTTGGLIPEGAMVIGWLKVDGSWYYFNSSGKMTTGSIQVNGTWYTFSSSGRLLE